MSVDLIKLKEQSVVECSLSQRKTLRVTGSVRLHGGVYVRLLDHNGVYESDFHMSASEVAELAFSLADHSDTGTVSEDGKSATFVDYSAEDVVAKELYKDTYLGLTEPLQRAVDVIVKLKADLSQARGY